MCRHIAEASTWLYLHSMNSIFSSFSHEPLSTSVVQTGPKHCIMLLCVLPQLLLSITMHTWLYWLRIRATERQMRDWTSCHRRAQKKQKPVVNCEDWNQDILDMKIFINLTELARQIHVQAPCSFTYHSSQSFVSWQKHDIEIMNMK